MENVPRDLRFAARLLAQTPGFFAALVTTLALGLGAATTVFSVVDAVLLRPLPYADPDRLVAIEGHIPMFGSDPIRMSAPDIVRLQDEAATLEHVAAFKNIEFDLTAEGRPERIRGARVSASLFAALGVSPRLGRTFTKREDASGAAVCVLSDALWQRAFARNPAVVGRTIHLDRRPLVVVGVMPASFVFPLERLTEMNPAQLWVPVTFTPKDLAAVGDYFQYGVIARLRPGATVESAASEAAALARRIQETYPPSQRGGMRLGIAVNPLHAVVVGRVQYLIELLVAAIFLVLVIAWVNVASLLLSRAMARRRELVLRVALGARLRHLVRQFVIENSLVSTLAAVLGVCVAYAGTRLIVAIAPGNVPRLTTARIDGRAAVFIVAASFVSALLVSLPSVWVTSRDDSSQRLAEGAWNSGPNRRSRRARQALVAAETGLAVVLLAASGLLVRSFVQALSADPGFNARSVLTFNVTLPLAAYPSADTVRAFSRELLGRLDRLPGAQSVGLADDLPMDVYSKQRVFTPETREQMSDGSMNIAASSIVSDGFLATLGVPLRSGRAFTPRDDRDHPRVVIVSESIARRFWPRQSAVGKRLKWGPAKSYEPWLTIVGVVPDVKQGALDVEPLPHIYEPYAQAADNTVARANSLNFAVRAVGDPKGLSGAVRGELWQIDPELAAARLRPMTETLDASLTWRRFYLALLVTFAVIALALVMVGFYGVVSYGISLRTYEIGIRMAMGALPNHILRMLVAEVVRIILAGLAIGLPLAITVSRFLRSALYNVPALDAPTYAATTGLVGGLAVVACSIPLFRATRVDPAVALRVA